jgi:hypothetical protein
MLWTGWRDACHCDATVNQDAAIEQDAAIKQKD